MEETKGHRKAGAKKAQSKAPGTAAQGRLGVGTSAQGKAAVTAAWARQAETWAQEMKISKTWGEVTDKSHLRK